MEKNLTQVPDSRLQKDLESPADIQLDTPSLADGQLGEIQEILFGQQLRSHTQQLASVHAYYSGLITSLTEDHQQQIKGLQSQFDLALKSMNDRLSAQGSEHDSKLTDVNKQMRVMEAELSNKISNSSEKQASAQQRLESELHQTHEQLSKKITSTRDEVLMQLQSKSSDLQSNKVDRDVLAGLLAKLTTDLSEHSNGRTADNTESATSTGVTRVEK